MMVSPGTYEFLFDVTVTVELYATVDGFPNVTVAASAYIGSTNELITTVITNLIIFIILF